MAEGELRQFAVLRLLDFRQFAWQNVRIASSHRTLLPRVGAVNPLALLSLDQGGTGGLTRIPHMQGTADGCGSWTARPNLYSSFRHFAPNHRRF